MAYSLSFTQEFFTGPYATYEHIPHTREATCIVEALTNMKDREWKQACKAVGLNYKHTDVWDMLIKIQETNTCSNLDSPVEVWIDPEGHHTIWVGEPDGNK